MTPELNRIKNAIIQAEAELATKLAEKKNTKNAIIITIAKSSHENISNGLIFEAKK
jgi:hypothetical protein